MIKCGQTLDRTNLEIWELLFQHEPEAIISEAFRLYQHKANSKTNSGFPEVEKIGVIRLYCQLYKIPHKEYMAAQSKGYSTDELLVHLGMFQKALRHANDAIRLGVLYLGLRRPNAHENKSRTQQFQAVPSNKVKGDIQ